MKLDFKQLTRSFRYWLIRKLSPSVWYRAELKTYMRDKEPFTLTIPRPSTVFASNYFGGRGVCCAEIGVGEGVNAESMLLLFHMKKLYLIDPYQAYPNHALVTQEYQNGRFRKAWDRLGRWKRVCCWIRQDSISASQLISDGSLDFLYIDGFHSFEMVSKEMQTYFAKVRDGGVMAGHDFTGDWLGVVEAVLRFVAERGLELKTGKADWWFVKA